MVNAVNKQFGRVEVIEDQRTTGDPGIVMRFNWIPNQQISGRLPNGFRLKFAVMRDKNGFHRVVPASGVEPFLLSAGLVGQTIGEHNDLFDAARVSDCDFGRLLFQQRHSIREAIQWHPNSKRDLVVPCRSRVDRATWNVIPEQLDFVFGTGRSNLPVRWLLEQGERQAQEFGVEAPTDEQRIAFGLYRCARELGDIRNQSTEDHAKELLRMALFCIDYERSKFEKEDLSAENFGMAYERIRTALQSHLEDDTEKFNQWFFHQTDTLMRQVSKQKRNGGPMNRELVREIRLKLILDAYQSLAICIHVTMLDVKRQLPLELTQPEEEYFGKMFCRQPDLGDLPLILLRDRLKSCCFDPITVPADWLDLPVLFRVLCLQSKMTSSRRLADRRYKRMPCSEQNNGRARPNEVDLTLNSANEPVASTSDAPSEIATTICELVALSCQCGTTHAIYIEESNDGDSIIRLACGSCDWNQDVPLTAEFRDRLAAELESS